MRWFAFSPVILFGVVLLAHAAVSLLVARGERARHLRHPARRRVVFQPKLIQGGKAQAPPAGLDVQETKTG